jgi:pre-mRNA-splicing factor CDC5/CEF1
VKEQMDHGEISGSIFDQVWTECYNEVTTWKILCPLPTL